jgi:hypothetical protein
MKIGNMTIAFRPSVMVMPLLCLSVGGNISGIPMLDSMISNMNQTGMFKANNMTTGSQGNQSMTALRSMITSGSSSDLKPSLCLTMSDAMLLRSLMMQDSSLISNVSRGIGSLTMNSQAGEEER